MSKRVVLATGNIGKIREMQFALEQYGFQVTGQKEYNVPPAIEDGLSFVENAIIKARHAARYTGVSVIADDSGLEVDALRGEPGIYSARYAGDHADDQSNNDKLVQELEGYNNRRARFHCVIVMLDHEFDPTPIICHGCWEGLILEEPRGKNGFGYDPLFYIPELNCTSAQLTLEQKNQISHRAQAMAELISILKRRSQYELDFKQA